MFFQYNYVKCISRSVLKLFHCKPPLIFEPPLIVSRDLQAPAQNEKKTL